MRTRRNSRVDLEGTPPAIFINDGATGRPANIAVDTNAGGTIIDFTQEASTILYYPYKKITINNLSDSDLNVYVNQRQAWKKIARAKSILTISENMGIRSVRISKRDAAVTIAAGEVEINVEQLPLNADEQTRRESKTPLIQRFLKNIIGV